jgi:KRAB domain-containing zinc finger protein
MNMRAEFGDKPYECVYCEKCFGKKEDLLKHVRTHAESQDFDDEDFDNYINLHAEEHFVIQNQEGDEEHFIFEQYDDNEGYQCSECDETYRDKLQMIIHMSFHVNSKLPNGGYKSSLIIKADSTLLAPYKCKFCEERFINKNYRSRHLCKCHRDEILQCEVCQKLFLYKETLKQHCKQHTIDTKYQCEYCQKCFTSKWFLKRHTRRHCAKRLGALEGLMPCDDDQPTSDTVDEYHHFNIEEKIETEQADSEIITDHFIKEEIPTSEVVMHMQMQSV